MARYRGQGGFMCFKPDPNKGFYGVAMFLIILGIIVFAYGVVAGVYNYAVNQICFAFPAAKAVGGLIVMSLGYIILELELLRKK